MTVVTTVRGDISPDELGYTSMHEHLNTDLSLMAAVIKSYGGATLPPEMLELRGNNMAFLRESGGVSSPDCQTLGDVNYTVNELEFFKQVGGNAIVDASPIGLRGDVRDLLKASERADVHVVFATGLYVAHARPEEFRGMREEELFEFFLAEVTHGVQGTGIRPGILKCALSALDPSTELNQDEVSTLRALGRVSKDTGLSLHLHTAFPMSHDQVLQGVDVALETGMAPDRLVMIHMDSFLRPWDALDAYISDMRSSRNISTDLQRRILNQGVNIGFDSWSATTAILPDDYDRLKGLADLLRAGYGSQIVMGHDTITKAHGKSYGYYGFTRFPQFVPVLLEKLGFSDEDYKRLVVDNPARILAH